MYWLMAVGAIVVWFTGYYFGQHIARETILTGLREGKFELVATATET